jgi:hypothetical protein
MAPAPDSVTFWAQLIGQVGFPVVVAGYLLTRVVPALGRLTSAIEHLVTLMAPRPRPRPPMMTRRRLPYPRPRSASRR